MKQKIKILNKDRVSINYCCFILLQGTVQLSEALPFSRTKKLGWSIKYTPKTGRLVKAEAGPNPPRYLC